MNKIRKSSHIRTSTRRPGQKLTRAETEQKQAQFLKSFASNGNVRIACAAAGIDRSTVRNWEEHDETFSMQYNLAKEDVNDAIRAEIFRRGMFGDEEYVTGFGKVVYHEGKPLTIRKKSDTLLMFHARARMPEYRDKQDIDLTHHFDQMAEQAKNDLLADLAATMPNEDKDTAYSEQPDS